MKTKLTVPVCCFLIALFAACNQVDDSYIVGEWSMNEGPYDEKYEDYGENPFIQTADEAVSTFSVDADGGSYTNMRRYLNLGQLPPTASVRIEEYLNFFTFNYAEPQAGENVALNSELAACPWNDNHHLLRLGIKGKTIPVNELPYSNYVFLIDVSGSMNSPEKLGVLKSGFKTLVDNLRDQDRMAIVTYAGSAQVLLKSTHGDEKQKIKNAIDKLGAGGSTAGAAGISTAYEIAVENYIPDGNNRIILGTDGDFNVGPSSTDELVKLIEEKRKSGIYLTVLGVGGGNLNDQMMEKIANNGNGNYEYIDNASQIEKVFTHELSKFYTVAKDAKLQLTFNPSMVKAYRLIGYENRALKNEDFEKDTVDAGEIGAGQTITALYELELMPQAPEKLAVEKFAQFDFRYKMPNVTESRLLSHEVSSYALQPIETASENIRFAASVAGFGMLIKESEYAGTLNIAMVKQLATSAVSFDPNGYRNEYLELLNKWK